MAVLTQKRKGRKRKRRRRSRRRRRRRRRRMRKATHFIPSISRWTTSYQ